MPERAPTTTGATGATRRQAPAPKYVVHPIYKSNDHFSIALQQGRLDMSSTFVPRIWRKAEKGVRTWFDEEPYLPAGVDADAAHQRQARPLSDVAYRRAMAFAINYTDIRELAVSDYSEPLRAGPHPALRRSRRKFFSAEDAKQYGARYDPARAKQILAEAGYKSIFNDKGELVETRDKNGTARAHHVHQVAHGLERLGVDRAHRRARHARSRHRRARALHRREHVLERRSTPASST